MRTALIPALLVTFSVAANSAQAQKDTIFWKDGTKTDGVRVTGFDLREVRYKKGRDEESKSSDRVERLSVDQVKDAYKRAYGAGSSERVSQFLLVADTEEDVFLRQFGYAEAGVELLESGEYVEAFQVLQDLVEKCPDSGFVPMYYREKINYYMSNGRNKDASTAAGKYHTAAQVQAFPEGFLLESEYFRAITDANQGATQPAALRKQMEGIVRKAQTNFPGVAGRARLAIADTLRQEGNLAEAATHYTDLIEDDKTASAVLGSAWLGMGHVHQAKGADDKEAAYAALTAFLRVYLDDNANYGQKAEALYHGSIVAKRWGGDGSARVSRFCRGLLLNRYSESEWAKR